MDSHWLHRLERLAPYGWTAVGMAVVYTVWIFAARDLGSGRLGVKHAEPLLPWLTSSEPRIVAFYTGDTNIYRGKSATLCYGVVNVKAVRLEPAVEQLGPSINRCFAVAPKETTSYTLVATGNDGRELSASFQVIVNPPPPEFLFVDTSGKEIVRGERWALCYGVKNATSVRLEPMFPSLPAISKHCLMMYPAVSTEFKLVIKGESGATESIKVPLKVKNKART